MTSSDSFNPFYGGKRPQGNLAETYYENDDDDYEASAPKRSAPTFNDNFGAGGFGPAGGRPSGMMKPPNASGYEAQNAARMGSAMSGHGAVSTVDYSVPDKYVGLIIGKNGEQILRIQKDAECKVFIAADSHGLPDRHLTLTGTQDQITRVKAIIGDIIEKADKSTTKFSPNYLPPGQTFVEMMVPGYKVGLVIGKNGETIKKLQEDTGVRMVMIQDSTHATPNEKPLRISGEAGMVEKAKQIVTDLLNSKDNLPPPPKPGQNGLYSHQATYAVPADKTGLIIGKQGETIKLISKLSGAYVGIQKQPPPDINIKIFDISGSQEQIAEAIRMICEKAGLPAPISGSQVYTGYTGVAQGVNAVSAGNMPAPTINPITGQPDYSAAWAEYYRSMGYQDYAESILQQAAMNQQAAMAATAAIAGGTIGGPQAGSVGMPTAGDMGSVAGGYAAMQQQQQMAFMMQQQQQQMPAAAASVPQQLATPKQQTAPSSAEWQQWQQWNNWQQANQAATGALHNSS